MTFRLSGCSAATTLGLCGLKAWALDIQCSCGRERIGVFGDELKALGPETMTLGQLAARLTCRACGGAEGVLGTRNARAHPGYATGF